MKHEQLTLLVKVAEDLLSEVVLDVMFHAKLDGETLKASEISERAGIFRENGGLYDGYGHVDAIVIGILIKLNLEKRVEKLSGPPGKWKLATDEFEGRNK